MSLVKVVLTSIQTWPAISLISYAIVGVLPSGRDECAAHVLSSCKLYRKIPSSRITPFEPSSPQWPCLSLRIFPREHDSRKSRRHTSHATFAFWLLWLMERILLHLNDCVNQTWWHLSWNCMQCWWERKTCGWLSSRSSQWNSCRIYVPWLCWLLCKWVSCCWSLPLVNFLTVASLMSIPSLFRVRVRTASVFVHTLLPAALSSSSGPYFGVPL